jgi:branched-chain amino acid transport system permease protein
MTLVRLTAVAAIAVSALVLPVAAAVAQETGEAIKGTLQNIEGDVREPVAGIRITVNFEGAEVGSAVSAEDGTWKVEVPGPGTYEVELDTDTLPEGIALTDPDRRVLSEVVVREANERTVIFQLGSGITAELTSAERLGDLFIFGLKFGAIIALTSIGLSLVFGVTKLVNFAHGELITLGAVLAFFFNASPLGPGWHIILAAIPAIALVGGFGWLQEARIWRPLRRRGTTVISMLVISIGMSFLLRHLILIAFEGLPRNFNNYVIQEEVNFWFFGFVPKNIVIIVSAVVVLGAVGLFLQKTKMGTAMRAVADDVDLAESSGINVEGVIRATWIVGAGLAALGGVFFGVSEAVQYDMGFRLLLFIFAAVVLGGLGTAYGAMVGGFVIGVAVEMSTFWVDVDFKNVVALGILIVMLLIRPHGLLGSRERIG